MDAVLLQQEWLAGDGFSLADIGLAPYVNRLDMLSMSGMWSGRLLGVERWFSAIRARPRLRRYFSTGVLKNSLMTLKNLASRAGLK